MSLQDIEQLFRELEARDIRVRLVDDRLRVNAPKAGMPTDLHEELTARKQEIIDFLIAAKSEKNSAIPRLVASNDLSPAPLSFGQQRIWLLHEINKEKASSYDTLTFNIRMQGDLDIAALQYSLTQILRRHEILRTVVSLHQEQPVQKVLAIDEVTLEIRDLAGNSSKDRDAYLEQILATAGDTFLDPATGPLFQAQLVRLENNDHLLIFIIHHMVFDGWSLAILMRELMQLYGGFLQGEKQPLSELALQYSDFARWQRDWLQGDQLDRHLSYWKNKLDGIATLELPLDYTRPATQTYNGSTRSVYLPREISDKLLKLGQKNDASLFMTMMTTLGFFLSRYTGQTDIAIGTPITSRDQNELQELIGFFLNTLVMRLDFTGEVDFLTLLSRCRQTCLDAFAHQHLPFEKLVEELQLERDQSSTPLFQVMFWLEGRPDSKPLTLPGLEFSSLPQAGNTTRFDLDVSVVDSSEGYCISFTYNTDLFNDQTICRMLDHYKTLLESIVAEPRQPAFSLPMLDSSEREYLLEQKNRTRRDYNLDTTLTKLFEAQVDKTPDSIAITFETDSLTYAQLDRRANQLAHCLQINEVAAGDTVSVFMNRSLEMVIALYAIHKAGAAYVPLDPEYPDERLGWMLEDTGSSLILSQTELQARLPSNDARVVCLDDDWQKNISSYSELRLASLAQPDDTAYIIYTSGSTGKPKGVMNTHRGIVNRLLWMQSAFSLTQQDKVLQKTPYSFDVSVWEFFWPLITGAQLVIARPEGHKDPVYLTKVIDEQGITILHFVPSMLRAYLESSDMKGAVSLKRVICSGEALPHDLQQQFFRQSNAELHNLYGPTEAAVDVSHWVCRQNDERKIVPIGYPIANTCLYILDSHLQLVPAGVAGELHIGGVQVSQGYLNRAELTAEKFIADPFDGDENARLYKTGDRARYLLDGSIEYLGRIDNQVKLRGFRIELGEIETVLTEYEKISAAVAVIREDIPASPQLFAYVTGFDGVEFDEEILKDFLSKRMPQYMVPSHITLLVELPLSANGKVDRKRLPEPSQGMQAESRQFLSPGNETEKKIAAILQELLNVKSISINDNFFKLGGHSLLAIKAVNRINQSFGSSMSLARFMILATVEKIAPGVQESRQADSIDSIPLQAGVDPGLDGEIFPLSSAQQRLWYIHALYPNVRAAYNIPLQIQLDTSVKKIETILKRIQQQYAILRTTYIQHGEQPVQKINQASKVSVRVIDVADFTEAEIRQEIARLETTPFNLETGPVWRCTIVKQDNRALALSITIHHIATDGWSMNLLKQEILRLCQQSTIKTGLTSIKPGIQYIDYALWQREQLDATRLEVLEAYWAQKLNGIPSAINLPIDKTRPPVYSHSGAFEFVALNAAVSNDLRQFARDSEITLFMLMLAAFKLLLSRYAQQSDIIVGTAVSGRTLPEMDDIIGLFVNSLVLRTDLSGSQTFASLLHKIRETTLDAFEHQELPFENIVEIVQPERDMSRNPVFQVMFTFNVPENVTAERAKQQSETMSEEFISGDEIGSHVDLALTIQDDDSQLLIGFAYNDDLFEATTVRQMLTHYRRLLEVSITTPETRIDQLEMLSDEEKQLMLHQWNQTQVDFDKNETLHSLIAQQVKLTPKATAVSFNQHSLDYAELEQKANDIAFLLIANNVEPGQLVGVFIERSLDLVVAILGILKAGAAYVPLDPEYPPERIDFMVTDSGIRVLLSQEKLKNQLSSDVADIIYLDSDKLYENIKPQELPAVTDEMLAYVIYTSGSTGKPKGVMVSHSAVVNHACWMRELFKFDQTDRFLQKSPLSFDASVCEIFVPLLNGACVVMAIPGGHKDSDYLIKAVRENKITTLVLAPAELRMLLQSLTDSSALSTLRRMGCGGDALTADLQRAYYEHCTVPLYNLYGPTESTIDAASFLCAPDFSQDNIPIGRPVSNSRAYILDPQLQPVPIGVHGELHIAGAQLAKGYLNQNQLTLEKFIVDPFSLDHQARMYKTGDLARYRHDGAIEYCGRIDSQVKLRGYRIELGELEAILLDHDKIARAAVIVREDEPGDQRMVAYLVPKTAAAAGATESLSKLVYDYLKQKLPAFMVPSNIEWMETFPLLPGGKVNYSGFPRPSRVQKRTVVSNNKPESAMEIIMARIWEELLDIDEIETDDMFFDLGGHSLLTLKVVDRFATETDIRIPPASLINQTLRQLAATAEAAINVSGKAPDNSGSDSNNKNMIMRG